MRFRVENLAVVDVGVECLVGVRRDSAIQVIRSARDIAVECIIEKIVIVVRIIHPEGEFVFGVDKEVDARGDLSDFSMKVMRGK